MNRETVTSHVYHLPVHGSAQTRLTLGRFQIGLDDSTSSQPVSASKAKMI